MFLWVNRLFYVNINSFKASLQSCHPKTNPNKSDIMNNPKRIKIKESKRTFSFFPSYYQASMCIEASLSFSFFFLFFINVFSIIFLFMIYTEDMTLLKQQGKALASYSYWAGEIYSEDDICLQKSRAITYGMPLLSTLKCKLYTRCVVKPWNGYDITKKKEENTEKFVYITEYGKVYHKNRGCNYLALSIEAVAFKDVEEKRNISGEKYLPCESCKGENFVTVVYITSYGNRYHVTSKCQGIKRTVKRVPFSELKGVSPCEKCGK